MTVVFVQCHWQPPVVFAMQGLRSSGAAEALQCLLRWTSPVLRFRFLTAAHFHSQAAVNPPELPSKWSLLQVLGWMTGGSRLWMPKGKSGGWGRIFQEMCRFGVLSIISDCSEQYVKRIMEDVVAGARLCYGVLGNQRTQWWWKIVSTESAFKHDCMVFEF